MGRKGRIELLKASKPILNENKVSKMQKNSKKELSKASKPILIEINPMQKKDSIEFPKASDLF